jgi:hypothetical protein
MDLIPLTFPELEAKARRIAEAGSRGHIHTTVPGCAITGDRRRAIVLEATDEGRAYAFFDDDPIEARARPLAMLLHGADSVPGDTEELPPASPAVRHMAEGFVAGRGHFHILNPECLANRHAGRWAIVFEDAERGWLESVSDERPLADIRVVEQLIYAGPTSPPPRG